MLKFPYMCRLCLIPRQLNTFIQIFDDTSEIPVKISELTNIKVESGDGLPQEMCILCRAQLDLSVTFKRQVEKANSMLRHHLAKQLIQNKNNSSEIVITGDPLSEERVDGLIEDEMRDPKIKLEAEENHGISENSSWDTIVVKVEDDIVVAEPWPETLPEGDNIAENFLDDSLLETCNERPESPVHTLIEWNDENRPLLMEVVEENPEENATLSDTVEPQPEQRTETVEPQPELRSEAVEPQPEQRSETVESQPEQSPEDRVVSELHVTKIKEESKQEVSASNDTNILLEDDKNILTEDEDDVTNLKLSCTRDAKCNCKFCSEKKKFVLWDSDDSSDECDLDLEKFKNKSRLKKRKERNRHRSKKKYKCKHCEKSFESSKGLCSHQRQHTVKLELKDRTPPPECTPTPDSTPTLTRALRVPPPPREHLENVRRSTRPSRAPERHVVPHYACSKCERMYSDQTALENHERSHIMGKPGLKCSHCSKKFFNKDYLEAHIQRFHVFNSTPAIDGESSAITLPTNQDQPLEQIPIKHHCNFCGKSYENRSHLFSHMRCHKIKVQHHCTICGKTFENRSHLSSHMRSHKAKIKVKHHCNVCGKSYENRSHLFSHMRSHKNPIKLKHHCNVCGNSYENRSHLFSHMRIHKSTVHLCEVCGKTVSLSAYPAHKRSHLNVNLHDVFQCDLCEKKFNSKVSLRTHKTSYHGPLKYTCEVCGKQFATMALMKHHQNTHSGKRDHVCQVCGRAFTLKITLKSHMRIHTGEMPYKCEFCGRQFTWKTTYRNHIPTCTSNPNYTEIKPPIKQKKAAQHFNIPQFPLNVPQELPIDYSEEAKYQVPLNYSEEARYRHFLAADTKNFPIILNLSDEMKYVPQQPINYTGDLKPFIRDLKPPV